jgi:hypothetical protein
LFAELIVQLYIFPGIATVKHLSEKLADQSAIVVYVVSDKRLQRRYKSPRPTPSIVSFAD